MRYASFHHLGRNSVGVIAGSRIVDLEPGFGDLVPMLRAGPLPPSADGAPSFALDAVDLLPPVAQPGKIFCVGHNYETHRIETGRERMGYPAIFTRFADTLTGHGSAIIRPRSSTHLDFEGELAVVIGTGGRHIAEADALEHVAGYSCANDASVRDWQRHTGQFTPGKNFPATGPLGPWLVTPDEMGDLLSSGSIETRLNGTIVQSASLGDMIFSVPMIISYISAFTALSPGDLILTGTPGGVGAKREPPLWMKPGDTVEIEIEGIGALSNSIADES